MHSLISDDRRPLLLLGVAAVNSGTDILTSRQLVSLDRLVSYLKGNLLKRRDSIGNNEVVDARKSLNERVLRSTHS